MTSAGPAAGLILVATLLAACGSSPEDRVARAAEFMNQTKSPMIASVRAEGNRLVFRYKEVKTGGLSDSEMTRMMTAGLCQIDGVEDLIRDGGVVRLELPRNFDYFAIDIDRCDA
ncbi:hypothetical protein [Sphingopyxis fribergensis]